MQNNRVHLRAYSKLEYGDPRGFLEALAPLDAAVSVSDLPPTVKHLRTNLLKADRERRDAAIFCLGMSHVLNTPVRFSPTEAQDYDFVATWEVDDVRHFCPIQLKEFVSSELNPNATMQAVLSGLSKYADSGDITVAIKIGRDFRFEPSELKVPSELSIAALWVYGAIAQDQSEWGLWGDFVRGSTDGIKFHIPR
jgi:hypothetical protein